jgi:large subunit ribosomal protein L20
MRIKRGIVSHRKHLKLLKSVSGFRMTKRRLVKVAKEASLHAGVYAYVGRRNRKKAFRSLWITRLSEYLKQHNLSYSKFIFKLNKAKIILNRKMMSEMIRFDPEGFQKLIDKVSTV